MQTVLNKLHSLQAHINLANRALWDEISENANPNKNLLDAYYVLDDVADKINILLGDVEISHKLLKLTNDLAQGGKIQGNQGEAS